MRNKIRGSIVAALSILTMATVSGPVRAQSIQPVSKAVGAITIQTVWERVLLLDAAVKKLQSVKQPVYVAIKQGKLDCAGNKNSGIFVCNNAQLPNACISGDVSFKHDVYILPTSYTLNNVIKGTWGLLSISDVSPTLVVTPEDITKDDSYVGVSVDVADVHHCLHIEY